MTEALFTVTALTSEQNQTSPMSVSFETTSYGDGRFSSAPFFVPRDQAYYWTLAWQRDEAEALREIAEGNTQRFASGAAAAEWLLANEEAEGNDQSED